MNLLEEMLCKYVGTAYTIRVYRASRLVERGAMIYGAPPPPPVAMLLEEFARAPQPPQGGDCGINEVTAHGLKQKYGAGKYQVEIWDGNDFCESVGVEVE